MVSTIATDRSLKDDPRKKRELTIGAINSILDNMESTKKSIGKEAFKEKLQAELKTFEYPQTDLDATNQEKSDFRKDFKNYLSTYKDKKFTIPGLKKQCLSDFNLFKKISASPSPSKTSFTPRRAWFPGFDLKKRSTNTQSTNVVSKPELTQRNKYEN